MKEGGPELLNDLLDEVADALSREHRIFGEVPFPEAEGTLHFRKKGGVWQLMVSSETLYPNGMVPLSNAQLNHRIGAPAHFSALREVLRHNQQRQTEDCSVAIETALEFLTELGGT